MDQKSANPISTNSAATETDAMKPKVLPTLLLLATISFNTLFAVTTRAGDTVLPLIAMDGVPLTDAINNLARQAGGNYILDSRVQESLMFSNRRSTLPPTITQRWTNTTASAALDDVLKSQNLTSVTNPVTTVTRIALSAENAKPIPTDELGADTSAAIPLIRMDDVPLDEAVKSLARQAGVTYALDPAVDISRAGMAGPTTPQPSVNIRWEKLTGKQALVALLDAYGLALVQNPGDPSAKIIKQP